MLNKPKLLLITTYKNRKKVRRYPSIISARKFAKTEANFCFKNGAAITLRVFYGRVKTVSGKVEEFSNKVTCKTLDDLKWALDAFLDKDLWLEAAK